MRDPEEFVTRPMTVPGQLELLPDDCPPHGLNRLSAPIDETHTQSLIETRFIREQFRALQDDAARWTPGGEG